MKCFNTLDGTDVGVPAGFSSKTKQVSVGRKQVCALNKRDKVKCWDYNKGVMQIPLTVTKANIKEVSAGQ